MDALIARPDRVNGEQKNAQTVVQKENDHTIQKETSNTVMKKINNKTYQPNELVLYWNEFKNEVKWLKAKIIKALSKFRYTIELTTRGSRRECHGDQLRPYHNTEIQSFPTYTQPEDKELEQATPTESTTYSSPMTSRNRKRLTAINHPIRRSSRLKGKPKQTYYESRARDYKKKKLQISTLNLNVEWGVKFSFHNFLFFFFTFHLSSDFNKIIRVHFIHIIYKLHAVHRFCII